MRGDTLAPRRPRLDRAGWRRPVARSALHGPAVAWGRPVREQAVVVRPGALRRAERGGIDGATVSAVQRTRRVEGIIPLTAQRLATQEARQLAAMAATWQAPPARAAQALALVRGVAPRGAACAVPLHACVMRCWKTKKPRPEPLVWVTPARELHASWVVRHAAERPAIAPDDAQRKSGGGNSRSAVQRARVSAAFLC